MELSENVDSDATVPTRREFLNTGTWCLQLELLSSLLSPQS
jgi:hypothetical protein